ncbi:MAG: aminotransferase class IV [Patescibacteria group bacterium]|jgi:branched-subunit amino acid aminotransferase/4-amino-4-deoxychorismate lyase
MPAEYVIKNGRLIPSSEASVSVYNKALFFDFAVYSNIKVVAKKMFWPELEIEKLFASARLIGLKHPFKTKTVVNWAEELIKKNKLENALIRVLLIGPETKTEPILFLFPVGLTFYPNNFYQKGVKVITYAGERFLPMAKTKNLLMQYLAYGQAVENGALDALLIDPSGNICGGTRSSFFVIKGNTLISSPDEKVLEGVTQKIILEIAPKIMKVKIADIALAKIKDYDEYFLTATTLNVMPVRQIDELVVASGVGQKTKALMRLFKEYCAGKMV